MSQNEKNNNVFVVNTVSAHKAPESDFQARADRACDLITHHNERGSKVVEEGMNPHHEGAL